MPRYEYKCKKCNKSFEVIHGINDSVDSCKFCNGEVRRVFHPVGIVFKGPGFYATDARTSNKSHMPQKKETGEDTKAADKPPKDKGDKKAKDSEPKSKKPAKTAS